MKHLIIILLVFTLIKPVISQEADEETHEYSNNSWGIGFGIPYGILGANVDVNIFSDLNFSFGLGTTILAGIGYNFGLKYFLSAKENSFRPRLIAFYGINSMSIIGDVADSYTGLSIGGGFQWMWGETKSNGLDLDIIYIATTGYDVDELQAKYPAYKIEELGKVKISIGYRHFF